MSSVHLTSNEARALRACFASEYADGGKHPSPWSWSVTEHSGLKPRSLGGVVASLVAKGLVTSNGVGTKQDDNYVAVTEAGFQAARAAGLIVEEPYEITEGNDIVVRSAWRAATASDARGGDDAPEPTPAPRKRMQRTPAEKLTRKSARRIVRAYLRCAIEMAMLAEAGDFDEALDLRIHALDAQLDAALEVLA